LIKTEAIERLEGLKERANPLANLRRGNQDFKKWHRGTEVAIERIFGEGTRHLKDFANIHYSLMAFSSATPDSAFDDAYRRGVRTDRRRVC
jgi:hypothetical protein